MQESFMTDAAAPLRAGIDSSVVANNVVINIQVRIATTTADVLAATKVVMVICCC